MADKDDRLFIRDGRKHFRRRYSMTEVKIGAVAVIGLAAIASWVAWKGAHPDPELFKDPPSLKHRGSEPVDRGPIPAPIAPDGWTEGAVSTFGQDNLYVKIDGREGYYKSFGFQRLWFVALTRGASSIDVEVYDLEKIGNAIGAFSGEIPETATAKVDGGLVASDRNATFLVRGRYYVRAIGSDESEETKAALSALAGAFLSQLPQEPLPWSFDLFVALGVSPGKIAFYPENAFSFGFAKDVHAGMLPDGETELFVMAASAEVARDLAGQFSEGFLQYGRKVGGDGGVTWVEDRYLNRVSTATVEGELVIGVRGAADVKSGASLLAQLRERIKSIPAGAIRAASPPPAPAKSKDPSEAYQ